MPAKTERKPSKYSLARIGRNWSIGVCENGVCRVLRLFQTPSIRKAIKIARKLNSRQHGNW